MWRIELVEMSAGQEATTPIEDSAVRWDKECLKCSPDLPGTQ